MKLVGYLRVSTDDRGQDPDRQRDVIEAWAQQNDHSIVRWVYDEGTSGAVEPLERKQFKRAVNDAKEYGAEGIVAETVDRITRLGPGSEAVLRVKLSGEHDLGLVYATLPAGLPEWVDEMIRNILASVGRAWREEHIRKVKAGQRRSMAAGWPNGKPGQRPKPDLDKFEWATVQEMQAEGKGMGKIAVRISQMRGAFDVADPKARLRRAVSENWIRKQLARRNGHAATVRKPIKSEESAVDESGVAESESEEPQLIGPDAEGRK